VSLQWIPGQRQSSTAAAPSDSPTDTDTIEAINVLIERINENDDDMAKLMEELELIEGDEFV
jgi:hypothetical protein